MVALLCKGFWLGRMSLVRDCHSRLIRLGGGRLEGLFWEEVSVLMDLGMSVSCRKDGSGI